MDIIIFGHNWSIKINWSNNLHNNVFAHGTVTNDDDHLVSRSKGLANCTKLTPINTFKGTS